jgi:hypothetical protein
MKQTAVEYLYKIIHARIHIDKDLSEYLEEAKEMEAKQKNHFVELSKWLIESNRGVFEDADISIESKRKILNELGYSSGDY